MAIEENKLKFSGKLIHSFLCKEIITSKRHEKWFVFARKPLRFSLQEYHAVTGLRISRESGSAVVKWTNDGGFWSEILRSGKKINLQSIRKVHLQVIHEWCRVDRLRLIYLSVIMGIVMGRDEKVNIPHMYIKMVMDLEMVRNFHWGLHSFDFLLRSIEKTRKKLSNKESYIFEGFAYAFQIWIMEAVPDLGEILGKRVHEAFIGPRCGNWKGAAKVSYGDIIQIEDSSPQNGELFSVISLSGNCDLFLHVDYKRNGEMQDERVDLLLHRLRDKFDWSSTEWPVLDCQESEIEEAEKEVTQSEGEEEDFSGVADVETPSSTTQGKGKRRVHDEGAEARKKQLLCKRSAGKKQTLDSETKSFIEGLIHTVVTSLGDKLSTQMANMESGFTERMGKMESEVSQLREAIYLSGEGSGHKKHETEEAPPKSKASQPPPKAKSEQPPATKKGEKEIGIESSDFDFGLSTQVLRDLSQDTFVDAFDLSQVKVEGSRKSRPFYKSTPELKDDEINRAGEASADAVLVYVREEDWQKVLKWKTSSKSLRIGPSFLDAEMADRLMDRTEWLHNLEIDAMMYIFRERATLKRWKLHRVAFMTVVFSNMIKKEYESWRGNKKKYTLHNLLLQFGKGVLPPHGRTHEIWNVDVYRLYVPVHVSGNHWISLCISLVMRRIDVFDCSGRKRYKELDAFSHLVPRIVKAVQPIKSQKDFTVTAYSVSYVQMGISIKVHVIVVCMHSSSSSVIPLGWSCVW